MYRRVREQEIVGATRRLLDERGTEDISIEDIAGAVGINKALIYRHFSSKAELIVLALTLYLDDLSDRLQGIPAGLPPRQRLEESWRCFTDFCLQYPAFVDGSLSTMRQPHRQLRLQISDAVWLQIGQHMAPALGALSRTLAEGAADGTFTAADPDFAANRLYLQTLGTMHLARIGLGVLEEPDGRVGTFTIDPARVQEAAIADVLAAVGAAPAAPPAN
jgi:AcrR family transcriptional regulator